MDVFATKVMERENYFTIANFETVTAISSQKCSTPRRKKKSNSMNKRRFSDVQIRSLESIFYSSDSKLDSRKKVQLASELGLQPRQVAIWFQNRRARWKYKQMENDFRSLRANYDNLASQFKSLQEEKKSLLSQLQKLSEIVQGRPCEAYNSYDIENTIYETRAKPKNMQDELKQRGVSCFSNTYNYKIDKKRIENGDEQGHHQVTHLLEDGSNNISQTEEQACQLLNPNGSFESSEKWCSFDSDGDGLQWPSFWE